MRKSKHAKILMAAIVLAAGLFYASSSRAKDAAPPAAWTLFYGDESGNDLRVWKRAEDSKIVFDYGPVRPEESSSGTYSGGEAKAGVLSEKDAADLWRRAVRLEAEKSLRAEARAMGTGAFTLRDAGGTRDFIVKQDSKLKDFDRFADKLVDASPAEETKEGGLPVYPVAVKETSGSGATSLPTGRNFTILRYIADAPVAAVTRFYEARLKGSRRIDNANGSVVFKSESGNVTLFKAGEGTKITTIQGPQ